MIRAVEESIEREAGKYAKKYYDFIFALPRQQVVVIVTLVLLALVVSIAFLLPSQKLAIMIASYSLSTIIASLLSSGKPLKSVKRALALIDYGVFIALIIILTLGVSRLVGEENLIEAIYPIFLANTIIVYGLGTLASTLAYITLTVLTGFLLIEPSIYALYLSTGFTLALSTYSLVFKKDIKTARAFIEALLDDNYRSLEELIERNSTTVETLVKITVLKTQKECIVIVIPKIHFGPLRQAFSSNLPYRIMELVERKNNVKLLVLHSDVDHHYNLSSKKEEDRIASIISEEIKKLCGEFNDTRNINETIIVPFEAKCSDFRCKVLPSILPTVIVDRPGKGIDDFMLDNSIGVFLVDAHNEEESEPITRSKLRELRIALKELKRKTTRINLSECSIAFEEIKLTEEAKNSLMTCKNWVRLFYYTCRGKKHLLILVPSNNAEHNVRSSLEKKIKKHIGDVSLVTLDDHTCSGLAPGRPSFVLANGELLANLVMNRLNNLENRALKIEKAIESILVISTKVWGKSYEELKHVGLRGKKSLLLLLLLYISTILFGVVHAIMVY